MLYRLTKLCTVLALCSAAPWAHAAGQEGAPRPEPVVDPLSRIVEEALANNLSLAQERLLEERAAAELDEARARYLPSLSIQSRYSEQSGTVDLGDFVNPVYGALNQLTGTQQYPTDLSVTLPYKHESRLRLTQTLFNERVRAGRDAADHAYGSQRARRVARSRALAAEAQTSYLGVAAALSTRRIWEETLALVQESERVAQRLVDVGTATPDAVFRARADRSDVEQRLAEAREAELSAARAFNHLLHRPLDASVDAIDPTTLILPIAISEEQAVAGALAGREELEALDESVASLDAGVHAATAGYLPELALALDYGFQGRDLSFGADNDFWSASVVLSWSVFSGGQTAARRHGAIADRDRMRLAREDTEDLVRLEARQAYQATTVAYDAIATAEDRRAAAAQSFKLLSRRYEEGLATLVELIDARTALTNAELNRVVTIYRYAMRRVELERAAALRDIHTFEGTP